MRIDWLMLGLLFCESGQFFERYSQSILTDVVKGFKYFAGIEEPR